MIEQGIISAAKTGVRNPLPVGWLGRSDAPTTLPQWASIVGLSSIQVQNLQAQIGYDASEWDYTKVGENNELGRYQFTTTELESYGLLTYGSNRAYGIDCVNRLVCWKSSVIRSSNSYANYIYNMTSRDEFLNSTVSQDHLCYQRIYDLYNQLVSSGGIQPGDSAEVIAGMISVAWSLGDGAYNWRYNNIGAGINPYNSGRYAVAVLSQ